MQGTNPVLFAKCALPIFTVSKFCLVVEEIRCQLVHVSLFRHDSYSLPTACPECPRAALHTGSSPLRLAAFHSPLLMNKQYNVVRLHSLQDARVLCTMFK